jgi:hypothetical protein
MARQSRGYPAMNRIKSAFDLPQSDVASVSGNGASPCVQGGEIVELLELARQKLPELPRIPQIPRLICKRRSIRRTLSWPIG